jgi:hypothetical protein
LVAASALASVSLALDFLLGGLNESPEPPRLGSCSEYGSGIG